MKNIKFKLLVFLSAFVLLVTMGCKKFVTVDPVSDYSVNTAFNSVANATTAIIGVYDELQGDPGYGIRLSLYYPFDSDEGVVTGNIDDGRRGIGRYNYTLTNTEISNPFRQLYRGIEKANLCIEQIPQMDLYTNGSAADQAQLKRMHGEALVLRAQFYHELIRNWGDVPAPMVPAYTLKDFYLPNTNRDSTYEKLIEDLRIATELLPWRTEAGSYNERITKGAAKALRARLALYRGGYSLRQTGGVQRGSNHLAFYQIAKTECEELMARRDQHTLAPDFETFWKAHNSVASSQNPSGEILFEVGAGGGNNNSDSRMSDYDGPNVNVGSRYNRGSPGINILPTYFYAFDSADTRRDVTICVFNIVATNHMRSNTGTALTTGKHRINWRNPTLGSSGAAILNRGMNWTLIRFSDVLLMYAEAANEIGNGPTPEAIAAFEEVRTRAYKTAPIGTTPTTKDAFFNAIVNERLLEFGGEGMRKYDLLRWGMLSQKLTEVRASLALLRQRVAPYNNVPQYLYYMNGGDPNSVGGVAGEGLQYYTTWAPTGGRLPFWKPTPTAPAGSTTSSPPATGAVTVWTRVNWAQQLTSNYADSRTLENAVGYLFEAGKDELMPYDQATITAYQGKLIQNPGH
jgi:hypothetical protein